MKQFKKIFPFLFLSLSCNAQQMWINEIHYDNFGSDVDEFVEVILQDTFAGNLSEIEVVFYNGSNGNVISQSNPRTLDTFIVGQQSGGFTIYSRIMSSIQNGNPDGLALVNNGIVVEFISYEGVIIANNGPAQGMTSIDIGVSEPGDIGESLQLVGTGNIPSYFTWQPPAPHTRGLVNSSQTLADIPAHVLSIFPTDGTTGVESTTAISIEFSEPITATSNAFTVTCNAISQNFTPVTTDNINFTLTTNSAWPNSSDCIVNLIASDITDNEGNNNQLDGNNDGTGGDDFGFSFSVTSDPLPRFVASAPANDDILVPVDSPVTINFSESVDLTSSAVQLDCQGLVAFTGLPQTNTLSITLIPSASFSQGDICTVTIFGNQITDRDGDNDFLDGDENGVAGGDYQFVFSVIEPIRPLYEIQGSEDASPIADEFVRTQGNIVTAIASSGFFIQTPDSAADASFDTSNALFVFSNAVVEVGDSVDIRGQVIEFYDLTELTAVSSVNIMSSGNAMPTIIEFDENTPSQDPLNPSCAIEFECYEGMLVNIANGYVTSGSQSIGADENAEVEVTATGSRTLREAGIEVSNLGDSQLPSFPSATFDPYVFDENPEIFELDVDALGLPSLEINGGSEFSATGVLTYNFGDFELWAKELTLTPRTFVPIRIPNSSEITIATQNMYRFFDGDNDPLIDDYDEDNTSIAEFNARVAQASLYFRTTMHAPDIIFLQEIENLVSVQAIADKMNSDDPSHNYSAYLEPGNDIGGIDIGILTKGTVADITVTQLGATEELQYGNTGRPLHDRPPLLINAVVTKGSFSKEVNVLGVHMRSRSGITGSQRTRIRNKRLEQSLSVANMVQDLQSTTIPLIVTGDFNDFEFSDGYADVIGEIKGVVEPIRNLLSSNGVSVVNPTLVNTVDTMPLDEKYSFIFRGSSQSLEHMLINNAALILESETVYVRGNVDAPKKYIGDYSQTLAMSDHDGLVLYLEIFADMIFTNGFE